ncbi:MAG: sulfatase, partial [Phycisphaerae bacterium]|nr:sulfatase [Phycisphaerae bacterium]
AVLSSFVLGSHTGLNQGFDYYDEYEMEWRKDESHNGRRAEDTTRLAGMWLEKHKSDRSFLFLHYYDPHLPYDPPQPFAGRFRSNPYAGEIAYTDKYIGRVIEKLKDLGLYDSSLIILTADHGEMLGEHGEHEHGYFIYEAAVKVPLIVKMPDGPRGKSVNDLAGIVDIFPSICAALGIPVPAHVQGKDLTGYLTARGGSAEDRYYYSESLWPTEYGGNSLLGVVTRRWKYIQTTKPELYDLEKNPEETDNLIGKQPKRAHLLREHLKLILEEQSYKGNSAGGGALDPETIKRLESLGYIASAGAGQSPHFDASRPDPKDLLPQHLLALKINLLETRKQHEE